jgi:hypothetical protein
MNDSREYAQVFNSELTGFSGTVSGAETIRALFSPVKARFVKITFASAGAAIQEVGVFMVQPPELTAHPTRTHSADAPQVTATLAGTSTGLLTETETSYPTGTRLPTETSIPSSTGTGFPTGTLTSSPTETAIPTISNTPPIVDTSIPLPTNTLTATSVPTVALPSDTPMPLSTVVSLPTVIPATPLYTSPDPMVFTRSNQTLTFTCSGNAVEVRGHSNTITLLGSCSSITVTGNGNQVFWQSGFPVITNKGNNNLISQR